SAAPCRSASAQPCSLQPPPPAHAGGGGVGPRPHAAGPPPGPRRSTADIGAVRAAGGPPGGGRSPYSGGMKILLPDTVPLDPVLPEGWEAVTVDARAEIPAEHHDAAVLVVWGPSRRHLASAAESLEALQLVQSLSAGVDGILAAGFAEHVVIATGAGLHSRTVSEHSLALLLSLVRRL